MNHDPSIPDVRPVPRWLHAWALLTVAATAVLLALGAIVTTFQVGMADPIWPTYPWHLLLVSWQEPSPGFLIEHTHRLAGYVVGCCVIVLAVGLGLRAPTRGLKWLGILALAGVILQGLLGGFRVKLNALVGTDLAAVHGCFAQVVFSLLVSLAVLTAPPSPGPVPAEDELRGPRRLSLALTALIFLQLVWGVLVRHTLSPLAQRTHLLTAFAVLAVLVWLGQTVVSDPALRQHLGRALKVLGVLLALQLVLGVEAWLRRFGAGVLPELQRVTVGQAVVRTGHVLVGSWVLAASVVVALRTFRLSRTAAEGIPVGLPRRRPASQLASVNGSGITHREGTT